MIQITFPCQNKTQPTPEPIGESADIGCRQDVVRLHGVSWLIGRLGSVLKRLAADLASKGNPTQPNQDIPYVGREIRVARFGMDHDEADRQQN